MAGVSFGDVNWSEEQFSRAFGVNLGPGEGGWPTIRHFNKLTGYGGKPYRKKTNEEMDAELGDEERMRNFVTEKSGISLCDVVWGNACSEMEIKYVNKWVGPDIVRNKNNILQEKNKWEAELRLPNGGKNFVQNKQRAMLLSRLLDNFGNPEL